jgi:hypothetical protein
MWYRESSILENEKVKYKERVSGSIGTVVWPSPVVDLRRLCPGIERICELNILLPTANKR